MMASELATPTAARITLRLADTLTLADDEDSPQPRTQEERQARRTWQLGMMKGKEFYQLAQTLKDLGHLEGYPPPTLPPTPDPLDVTISKRQWEKQLAEWKKALRAGFAPFYVG